VQRKIVGSDRCTKIIESIQAYKDIVKDSTGGQEAVGFERVAENVQVHQQVFAADHSGVSLLCKQSILDLRI
jgi:hypothetical protein